MSDERILDAVLDVLADRGVEGLSIRSIAATANVSPAQVQYYYRNKQELVRAGLDHSWSRFLETIRKKNPQTVSELVDLWLPLDEVREKRARAWLAYTELAARDPELMKETGQMDQYLRDWFVQVGLSQPHAAQLLALIDGTTTQCLSVAVANRSALAEQTIFAFLHENSLSSMPLRTQTPA